MVADNSVLRELATLFSGSPSVTKAVLFGSRARGDCTEKSDYDVAVFGDVPGHEKNALRTAAAEELPTLHKIDLIFVQEQCDKAFLQKIEKEGILIYDKAGK